MRDERRNKRLGTRETDDWNAGLGQQREIFHSHFVFEFLLLLCEFLFLVS